MSDTDKKKLELTLMHFHGFLNDHLHAHIEDQIKVPDKEEPDKEEPDKEEPDKEEFELSVTSDPRIANIPEIINNSGVISKKDSLSNYGGKGRANKFFKNLWQTTKSLDIWANPAEVKARFGHYLDRRAKIHPKNDLSALKYTFSDDNCAGATQRVLTEYAFIPKKFSFWGTFKNTGFSLGQNTTLGIFRWPSSVRFLIPLPGAIFDRAKYHLKCQKIKFINELIDSQQPVSQQPVSQQPVSSFFKSLNSEDKKLLTENPLLCYDALFSPKPQQGENMSPKHKKINNIINNLQKNNLEKINFQDSLLKDLDKSNREYFLDSSGVREALEKSINQSPKHKKECDKFVEDFKKGHISYSLFREKILEIRKEYFLDSSGVRKALEKFINQSSNHKEECDRVVEDFKKGHISYSVFRQKILEIVKSSSVHPKLGSPDAELFNKFKKFKKFKKSKLEITLPEGLGLNTFEQEMLNIDNSIQTLDVNAQPLNHKQLKKKRILEIIKKDINNEEITNWLTKSPEGRETKNLDDIMDTEDKLKNFLKFCDLQVMKKSKNINSFLDAFNKAQHSETDVKDLLEFCNLKIMDTKENYTKDLLDIFLNKKNDKELSKEFAKFCHNCLWPLDKKAENYIKFVLKKIQKSNEQHSILLTEMENSEEEPSFLAKKLKKGEVSDVSDVFEVFKELNQKVSFKEYREEKELFPQFQDCLKSPVMSGIQDYYQQVCNNNQFELSIEDKKLQSSSDIYNFFQSNINKEDLIFEVFYELNQKVSFKKYLELEENTEVEKTHREFSKVETYNALYDAVMKDKWIPNGFVMADHDQSQLKRSFTLQLGKEDTFLLHRSDSQPQVLNLDKVSEFMIPQIAQAEEIDVKITFGSEFLEPVNIKQVRSFISILQNIPVQAQMSLYPEEILSQIKNNLQGNTYPDGNNLFNSLPNSIQILFPDPPANKPRP